MKRIIAATSVAVLAGCSLIYASDLDDARDPPTLVDSGGADARSPAVDGSAVVDGGSDANPITSADAGGCAAFPNANFCEDFDDPAAPLDAGWTLLQTLSDEQHTSGSLAFDTGHSVSAPRGARVGLDGSDTCGYVRFEKRLETGPATRIHVRFSFQPSFPWSNQLTPFVFALQDDTANGYCAALMTSDADSSGKVLGTTINVQSATAADDVHGIAGLAPNDTWTVIDLVVTPETGGGAHFHYMLTPAGGAPAVSDLTYKQCPTWTHAQLYAGFHCDTGHAVSYYDDIEADWQ